MNRLQQMQSVPSRTASSRRHKHVFECEHIRRWDGGVRGRRQNEVVRERDSGGNNVRDCNHRGEGKAREEGSFQFSHCKAKGLKSLFRSLQQDFGCRLCPQIEAYGGGVSVKGRGLRRVPIRSEAAAHLLHTKVAVVGRDSGTNLTGPVK